MRWHPVAIGTIDMLYCLVAALVVLVAKPEPVKSVALDKPICQLAVDINWPADFPTDVDLWVQAPGDRPVGYSNKEGAVFNLVRDDLGTIYATDPVNAERACARFITDGEWTVNVHLYATGKAPPVPVDVIVSFVDPAAATMTPIIERHVVLEHIGQELTVVRWKMKDGQEVGGSEHDIPKGLRKATTTTIPEEPHR